MQDVWGSLDRQPKTRKGLALCRHCILQGGSCTGPRDAMYVSVLCVIHGIRIELHCAVLALQQVYILHLTGHWYAVHYVQCRSVQLIYLQTRFITG